MSTRTHSDGLTAGFVGIEELPGIGGARASVGHRRARAGDLRDAYPSGTHDIELGYIGRPEPAAVADYTAALLRSDPRCRRVVLPVPELDLEAIGWAEEAGYRYVIDVETQEGGVSLLVTEPQWVLDQPAILEDIPLKEQA
ncbi:hypothetical protein [Leucobacter weissii]|uniref:hypothetical protein n=1 Tax=Leucobacter weissii TaxID=1983706 RepID=UPI001FB6F158|nr:hypothetical protein [Leucobacter weissii]